MSEQLQDVIVSTVTVKHNIVTLQVAFLFPIAQKVLGHVVLYLLLNVSSISTNNESILQIGHESSYHTYHQ